MAESEYCVKKRFVGLFYSSVFVMGLQRLIFVFKSSV